MESSTAQFKGYTNTGPSGSNSQYDGSLDPSGSPLPRGHGFQGSLSGPGGFNIQRCPPGPPEPCGPGVYQPPRCRPPPLQSCGRGMVDYESKAQYVLVSGPPGPTGPRGSQGEKGCCGDPGGSTGPTGPTGYTGATGSCALVLSGRGPPTLPPVNTCSALYVDSTPGDVSLYQYGGMGSWNYLASLMGGTGSTGWTGFTGYTGSSGWTGWTGPAVICNTCNPCNPCVDPLNPSPYPGVGGGFQIFYMEVTHISTSALTNYINDFNTKTFKSFNKNAYITVTAQGVFTDPDTNNIIPSPVDGEITVSLSANGTDFLDMIIPFNRKANRWSGTVMRRFTVFTDGASNVITGRWFTSSCSVNAYLQTSSSDFISFAVLYR